MRNWTDFQGPNLGYVVELYEQYRQDSSSVSPTWRALFDRLGPPAEPEEFGLMVPKCDPGQLLGASQLAETIRERGHLEALLDPLRPERPSRDLLRPSFYGLSQGILSSLPAGIVQSHVTQGAQSAGEVIDRLRQVYCGTVGYEFGHLRNPEARGWLYEAVESGRFALSPSAEEEKGLLERLTQVEAFELFLHRAFPGQTRFSIEGTDALVPMLDEVLTQAAVANICEVIIGSAHRGRLNVLAHVVGMPYVEVIARFQGAAPPEPSGSLDFGDGSAVTTGDVRYHLGGSRPYPGGEEFRTLVKMPPNPSHLEFVSPVVEGMVRAALDDRRRSGAPGRFPGAALAVLIHGEAAFTGQGIVAETLNLSRLAGYSTGGTLHVLVNNQLGFTEEPAATRSTRYASDLAKGFEMPIVHVNADDILACLSAIRLGFAYRQHFQEDFVVDLIGYRRRGHNEGDEPAFTQPLVYDQIAAHPTVRAIWAKHLLAKRVVSEAEVEEMRKQAYDQLDRARISLQGKVAAGMGSAGTSFAALESGAQRGRSAVWSPAKPNGDQSGESIAAVSAKDLVSLNEALLKLPPGFALDSRLERVWRRRAAALGPEGGVDWAQAEALAFASILADGTPIRLTGEDTARGTFSQRHTVLHDRRTGQTYTPLQSLPQARASFAIDDSPLSEAGALGFEYGYGVEAPETLVVWEAQYGDFANGAQVIIDQFIASGYAKWRQTSSLVLLLPHGYEGQGPEHSSARVERFLQLAAGDNLRVAIPSTASQYFHLLRQQASLLRMRPRPLVIFTPKSLLRNPRAASPLEAFVQQAFQPVIADSISDQRRAAIVRLLLCSGKVYYDLTAGGTPPGALAVARVERLYPFPQDEIAALITSFPALREVVWLQEEPQNMGAWTYMAPRLRPLLPREVRLEYVGRPEMASTAEGSSEQHAREQARIVAEGLVDVSRDQSARVG